jgi:hypothetical protein
MIYTYTLSWEQNMGGGRGINMSFDTQEWETARLIWVNLIKYASTERVRDFKAVYKKSPRHKPIPFNPETDGFPRPPRIMA